MLISKLFIFPIFAFAGSSIISYYLTSSLIRIGQRYKSLLIPESRKNSNSRSLMRIGGAGIYLSFVITFFIIFYVCNNFISINISPQLIIFLLGTLTFLLIGLTDDFFPLRAIIRLFAGTITSILLWGNGFQINFIDISFFNLQTTVLILPTWISIILTAVWIVGITNAFNWIDGLDGLLAGCAFITFIAYIYINLDRTELLIVICLLAGSTLGFLQHNKFPARIFLGDGGSYFIGSSIALLGIYPTENNSNINIIIPILISIIPIFDMIFVIYSRFLQGESVFLPNSNHIHHRLLKRGLSEINTANTIYGLSIIFIILALIIR